MNHLIRMDKKDDMVYLTCQTDGESLFWVWELSVLAIEDYFGYRYGVEDFTKEVALDFINDESLLEDSEDYESGKGPVYGVWYAPLTMEQVEQTLEDVDPVEEILATLPNKVRDEIEIERGLIQDRTERAMLWGYLRALEHMGVIAREQRHILQKVK